MNLYKAFFITLALGIASLPTFGKYERAQKAKFGRNALAAAPAVLPEMSTRVNRADLIGEK